jgi:protein SCO1/2
MTLRTARILVATGAFLAGLVLVTAIALLVSGRGVDLGVQRIANVGGPFRLTDHEGRTVTDKDLKGRPFLVFFGFTHCPDVCPTALFEISEILRKLGPDGEKARALFITVDPERDTPQALKQYLSSFDPRIIGLTGDPAEIAAVVKAYRGQFRKVPLADGGYTMDHTAIVYLMGKDGRFVAPFSLKRTTDAAAAELRKQL